MGATATKNTFDLYWSPEGRKIATITARSESAAIRKAPKPYRRYLGEIYAVKVQGVDNATIQRVNLGETSRRHSGQPVEVERLSNKLHRPLKGCRDCV